MKKSKTKKKFNYEILGTISIDTMRYVWYCIVKQVKRSMGIMKVGYVRVSTEEQNTIRQEILEKYKRHAITPSIEDYDGITMRRGSVIEKRHESDYYLIDEETGQHYLIELKIGGDLDNKKARSEKEALLEQYCILTNQLGEENVKILFATAYNRYGEGMPWTQGRVLQFFAKDELCISRDFWNVSFFRIG